MTELTLLSSRKIPLKPLVEAAIHNELRILESGIRRTNHTLQKLETQHDMTSDEFVRRYDQNQMKETLEFAEWIGEYRLLKRLQEKEQTLREVQFAD